MPTWEELDRGYYDPRLGTYITTNRINWPQMAQQTWGQPGGGLNPDGQAIINKWARGYYNSDWGTYIPPNAYDWRFMAGMLNLPAPSRIEMSNLQMPPRLRDWQSPGSQTPMPPQWDTSTPGPGITGGPGDWGLQAGQQQSPPARPGALWQAGQQQEQQREQENPWGGGRRLGDRSHPPNAVYVSDDGLVSYDAQGYRLDWYGNRAL